MRILVTDPVISRFASVLTADGGDHDWTFAAEWDDESLLRFMPGVDIIVCSGMTPAMARAGGKLRLVHVTGAGFEKIPLAELAPDVRVANTFHHGRSIAEYVIMVALMLSRRVLEVDREMRSGLWRSVVTDAAAPLHMQLDGRTIGVIGFGSIGQEVGRLATALGMRVRAVRQNPGRSVPSDIDLAWVGGVGQLEELVAESDFVVATVPLDESTRGLVDDRILAAMKPTAFLVNVSRGAVVDEDALHDALARGVIAGAAIDVWWGSPVDPDNPPSKRPFTELPNVIVTPHSSGTSRSTYEHRAADIAANVSRLTEGRSLLNIVHPREP